MNTLRKRLQVADDLTAQHAADNDILDEDIQSKVWAGSLRTRSSSTSIQAWLTGLAYPYGNGPVIPHIPLDRD